MSDTPGPLVFFMALCWTTAVPHLSIDKQKFMHKHTVDCHEQHVSHFKTDVGLQICCVEFISSNFVDRILLRLVTPKFKFTSNSLNAFQEVEFNILNT